MPQLSLVPTYRTDIINMDALDEWREYRRAKKKPMSELAEKKVVKLLSQYSFIQQQAMIDASIMNDWQGLFPPTKDLRKTSIMQDLTDTSWAGI